MQGKSIQILGESVSILGDNKVSRTTPHTYFTPSQYKNIYVMHEMQETTENQ